MDNKSQKSMIHLQKLELPKGGGAIRGIGESFSANEFSGTSSFSLPIQTSPCRGFEPSLSLDYSSGSGNGACGLGFSLSLPNISRRTNRGTPQYHSKDDFIISGSDYLVPIGSATKQTILDLNYLVQKYAPRKEGGFDLIEYWQYDEKPESAKSFWKVTTKDHIVSIFGFNPQAQIANPADPDQVFMWCLEESYDAKGNHQILYYKQEDTLGVPSDTIYEKDRIITANRYIDRICYGNDLPINDSILLGANNPDSVLWHFEHVFDYGQYDIAVANNAPYKPVREWQYRPDAFSNYNAGFEIRTYRRCFNILLFHRFKELGDNPILTHASSYNYELNEAGISIITKAREIGYQWNSDTKNYQTASYPDLELAYSTFTPNGHDFGKLTDEEGKDLVDVNRVPHYSLVDLHGEGISGILYADGTTVSYRRPDIKLSVNDNEGPSSHSFAIKDNLQPQSTSYLPYKDPEYPQNFPVGYAVQGNSLRLMDVTGNGRLDLLLSEQSIVGYWESKTYDGWENFKPIENFPADFLAPSQVFVDATGNGLSDLLQIIANMIIVYPSKGSQGFGSPIVTNKLTNFPASLESAPQQSIHFADIDGSGKQHLIKITQNQVSYWPNLSYGRFGAEVLMANSPQFPEDFDSSRIFLVDTDGSGTADIIYINARQATLYLNFNGNAFKDPITIDLPSIYSSTDQIAFADIFGRGNSCMIISRYTANDLIPSYLYYDFCQRQKPYLLKTTKNNMGASTEITYGSSVDFYLADKKAGLPWITNIPFPVHVVTKITHRDEISNSSYSSYYKYHHGYYDGVDREFRGFGRVDRQDSEYFPPSKKNPEEDPNYVAPALSKTWYETGCYEKREELLKQYKKEYYQGDKDAFILPDSVIDLKHFIEPDDKTNLIEAYRALAGTMIRSEVYGLDENKNKLNPYSVNEANYYVRLDQPKGNNNYAVCFVHNRESLSYNYERHPDDPQIHHSFILEVDEFGNVKSNCEVAYGRRPGIGTDVNVYSEQQTLKVTYGTYDYANNEDPEQYLLGVPIENKSYEIKGLDSPVGAAFTFKTVEDYINKVLSDLSPTKPFSDNAVLLGWNQTLYAKVDEKTGKTVPLDLYKVALPLLPYLQKTAEFLNTEIDKIFDTVLTQDELQKKLKESYYQFDDNSKYWWSSGLKAEYSDTNQFYLPKTTLTPSALSTAEEIVYSATSYTYDHYNILLTSVEDALSNKTTAQDIDYQTLHPNKVIDMNGRVAQVSFDPLGHVIYTTMYGYEEGKPKGFAEILSPIMKPIEKLDPKAELSDIIGNPSKYLGKMQSYFYYDVFAWQREGEPVRSLSLVAEDYPDEASNHPPSIQIHLTYNDGFGRNLVSKLKVEAGESFLYNPVTKKITSGMTNDRWLASGRVQYNNKGNPVKEYEPYYINTPDYVTNPILDEFGVSPIMYYDPLDRVTKVVTAKGFLTKSEWTPWESISHDTNNTIKESLYYKDNIKIPNPLSPFFDKDLTAEGRENIKYAIKYFNTKITTIVDNLGRNIVTLQIKKSPDDLNKPLDLNNPDTNVKEEILVTTTAYDILGRVINNVDPRFTEHNKNNPDKKLYNFEMFYVMGNKNPLKTVSADGGTSWILANTLGNPIYLHNSRNVSITNKYDELNRLITVTVQKPLSDDPKKDPLVLDQITKMVVYGDTPGSKAPENYNLKGQVYRLYDEAGLVTTSSYSLIGGVMKTERRFLQFYTNEVNWNEVKPLEPSTANGLLQDKNYPTKIYYDALGRIKQEIDADENQILPHYYESGLLRSMTATTKHTNKTINYVKDILYNAKGQRLQVIYGNDAKTNYQYDPKTFAVINISTVNTSNEILQNLDYQYDPAGNIFQKDDLALHITYYNNQATASQGKYLYNSLYQLIQGTGPEKIGNGKVIRKTDDPYKPFMPGVNNNEAIQKYMERYTYDVAGNLIKTNHIADNNNWSREMIVSGKSNRAVISTINNNQLLATPGQVDNYFDNCGNQIQMQTINPLMWDYRNQLSHTTTVQREEGNDDTEYYIYDASGSRVRKVSHKYNAGTITVKEMIYLGVVEIRKTGQGTIPASVVWDEECHSLYLSDSGNKVAQYDYWLKGSPPDKSDINSPYVRYNLSDNLGSCTLQLDEDGNIISREEYSPYGSTTLFIGTGSSNQLKYYRYSGKEKDATGLYYYGARYYAPWIGRWLSPDPAGTIDGLNLFAFVGGNPVSHVDIGGLVKRGKGKKKDNGQGVGLTDRSNSEEDSSSSRDRSNSEEDSSSSRDGSDGKEKDPNSVELQDFSELRCKNAELQRKNAELQQNNAELQQNNNDYEQSHNTLVTAYSSARERELGLEGETTRLLTVGYKEKEEKKAEEKKAKRLGWAQTIASTISTGANVSSAIFNKPGHPVPTLILLAVAIISAGLGMIGAPKFNNALIKAAFYATVFAEFLGNASLAVLGTTKDKEAWTHFPTNYNDTSMLEGLSSEAQYGILGALGGLAVMGVIANMILRHCC